MTRSTLFVPGRPLTLNRERTLSKWARAKEIKEWRKAAWLLALAEKLPRYDAVRVMATPHLKDRRTQDVSACHPSVKAIIDGLVDAKILVDDTADLVACVCYFAPVLKSKLGDGIEIELYPASPFHPIPVPARGRPQSPRKAKYVERC